MASLDTNVNPVAVIRSSQNLLKEKLDVVDAVNRLSFAFIINKYQKEDILKAPKEEQFAVLMDVMNFVGYQAFHALKSTIKSSDKALWNEMLTSYLNKEQEDSGTVGDDEAEDDNDDPFDLPRRKKFRRNRSDPVIRDNEEEISSSQTGKETNGENPPWLRSLKPRSSSPTTLIIDESSSDKVQLLETIDPSDSSDDSISLVAPYNPKKQILEKLKKKPTVKQPKTKPGKPNKPNKVREDSHKETAGQPSSKSLAEQNPNLMFYLRKYDHLETDSPVFPDSTNRSGLCKIGLGDDCFVTAGMWEEKQEMRINIRQYELGGQYPCPGTGVSLPLGRWILLREIYQQVEDVIDYNSLQEKTSRATCGKAIFHHIGGNVFIVIKKGDIAVDLRKYWNPRAGAAIKPTQYGIQLSMMQWKRLNRCFDVVEEAVPEIKITVPCAALHKNSLEITQCNECYPKPAFMINQNSSEK